MKNIYYLLIFFLAGLATFFVAACSEDEVTRSSAIVEVIGNPVTGITITNATGGVITLSDINAAVTAQVSGTPSNAEDAGNYVFTSSDNKVFSVTREGVITATGYGEATLSVVAQHNTAVSATCKVLVVGTRVTAIEFNPSTFTITRTNAAGPVTTLAQYVTITPSDASVKTLKYTSSNPEVAIISDDGDVWALWEGTTIIKVEALDGSGVFTTCTYTVNITPVTSITFNNITLNNVSNVITTGSTSGTLHINDVSNALGTSENLTVTIPRGSGTTANNMRYQPSTASSSTFSYNIPSNENAYTVEANTSNALVITPNKGVAGSATISIDATDGYGAHAELTVVMHKTIDRTNWSIVSASPSGVYDYSENDHWGGPIENIIKDGISAGLVKNDTYNNNPQGIPETYFTIDMGATTTFDYVYIALHDWVTPNNYIKINRFTLSGSNDNATYTLLTSEGSGGTGSGNGTFVVPTNIYNIGYVLTQPHTYRYLKVVVWNTNTGASYKNVPYWLMKDFKLCVGPQ